VQVVGVLVDVSEAADSLSRKMGDGRAQLLVLGLGRFVLGRPDGVEAVHLPLVGAVDKFAIEVDVPPHPTQALDVFFFCSHVSRSLLSMRPF
jgi:hypothetical protein